MVSEIQYTVAEHYDLKNDLYMECELSLCEFQPDYIKEKIVMIEQFSYWKYVRN